MTRIDAPLQRVLVVTAIVVILILTSKSTWASEKGAAYNMGYVDACNHSGGDLVDYGDRYHCYPKGGVTGTDLFKGASFVGSVPGGQVGVGIGQGTISEARFCDPAIPALPNQFNMVFPTQRVLELAYGSPIIDSGIIEAMRSGRNLHLEGYAFDGDVSYKSKGVLSWLPNGVAQMKFSTNCATPDRIRTDAIKYFEELGVNRAMIIERFVK